MKPSTLLTHESPLVIQPSLACAVGLNGAIVIHQVHYWISKARTSKNGTVGECKNGGWWISNTYEEWQVQFPFWSEGTIRRTFAELERGGYLKTEQPEGPNRRKAYTVDYQKLHEAGIALVDGLLSCDQLDQMSEEQKPDALSEQGDQNDQMSEDAESQGSLPSDQVDRFQLINLITPSDQLDQLHNKEYIDYSEIIKEIKDSADAPIGGQHDSTPPPVEGESTTADPPVQSEPVKPLTDHQRMFEAICTAFGYDPKHVTDNKRGVINKASKQLREAGATPGDVPDMYDYCKDHFDRFGPGALASYWDDVKAERAARDSQDDDDDPLNDPAFMARAKRKRIPTETLQELMARAKAERIHLNPHRAVEYEQ